MTIEQGNMRAWSSREVWPGEGKNSASKTLQYLVGEEKAAKEQELPVIPQNPRVQGRSVSKRREGSGHCCMM